MSITQKSVIQLAIQRRPMALAMGVINVGIPIFALVSHFAYDRPLNLVLIFGSPLVVLVAVANILNTTRNIRREMRIQNNSGSPDIG